MRSILLPFPITWGSLVNTLINRGAPKYIPTEPARIIRELITQAANIPFFTRLYLRAPMFCPTKVVIAILKL